MNTLTKWILVTMVAIPCLDTVVAAQPPVPGPGQGPGRALNALGLTPEQRQRLRQILSQDREQLVKARQSRQAAAQAFRSAVQSGDPQQIKAAGEVLGKAITELALIRAKVDSAMKEVLTPEQWDRLQAIRQRARQALIGPNRPIRPQARPGLGPKARPKFGPPVDRGAQPLRPAAPGNLNLLQDRRIWKMVDRDGDGAITKEELKAYVKPLGPRPRPGRP